MRRRHDPAPLRRYDRPARALRFGRRLALLAPLLLLPAGAAAQEALRATPEPLSRPPEVSAPRAPAERIAELEARVAIDAERIAALETALVEARRALETLRTRGLNQTLEEDQAALALRACETRLEAAERAEAAAERAAADAAREVRTLETRLRSAEAAERRAETEARNLRLRTRRCP